jgi:hypothetical protein
VVTYTKSAIKAQSTVGVASPASICNAKGAFVWDHPSAAHPVAAGSLRARSPRPRLRLGLGSLRLVRAPSNIVNRS